MPEAISNTSPFLYTYRIGGLDWLPGLFGEMWIPDAVAQELDAGRRAGYDVPDPYAYEWVRIVEPVALPPRWLALDLGAGELAAMALALENPTRVVLLDDLLARRTAKAAGLDVWGTLRVMLEAKNLGMVGSIAPLVGRLADAGMWLSDDVCRRILALAGE